MCQVSSQKPSIATKKGGKEGCKSMKIGAVAFEQYSNSEDRGGGDSRAVMRGERKNNDATRMTGSNSS